MIYAISDIHGQYELYKKLLNTINFSPEDELYILGDVIDRGPESHKLLLDIINRENVFYCLGNHELMMWSHFLNDKEYDFWFKSSNGGKETHEQLLTLSREERAQINYYLIHKVFLQIEKVVEDKTFLLSHSYFLKDQGTVRDWRKGYPEIPFRVTWYSPWRFDTYVSEDKYDDNRIHIIGHVPVQYARYDIVSTEQILRGQVYDIEEIKDRTDILKELNIHDKIINIDGGCALFNSDQYKNVGLICMNLTNYAQGKENSFIYLAKEN